MKANVGSIDRAVRIVIGLALIGATLVSLIAPWERIGVVPLLTGTFRLPCILAVRNEHLPNREINDHQLRRMNMSTTTGPTQTHQSVSKNLTTLRTGIPDVMKGFNDMAKAATQPGALDKKTKELIALALGVAAHCDACTGSPTRRHLQN